jgi:hypothetical protein
MLSKPVLATLAVASFPAAIPDADADANVAEREIIAFGKGAEHIEGAIESEHDLEVGDCASGYISLWHKVHRSQQAEVLQVRVDP